jgi:hypothetical protein
MMCCYSKAFSLTLFHSSTLLSGVSNNKTPVRSLALRHQYLDDERKIIIFFRNIPPLVTEFKAMEWEILGTNSMFTAPTVCDSESAYTWRSVGSSWRRAPSGTFRFRLKSRQLRLCRGASSLSRGRVWVTVLVCLKRYEDVSKSFQTGRLEREPQMVQLSAIRRSCIAISWVSLVSIAAITLCVASQRVFIFVSVYFVIDSVRKFLDTPWYIHM